MAALLSLPPSLSVSLVGFFSSSSSLNLGFSSLEVNALIEPRDQQQEADVLTEDGDGKKTGGGGGGGLTLETASHLPDGHRREGPTPRGREVGVEPCPCLL